MVRVIQTQSRALIPVVTQHGAPLPPTLPHALDPHSSFGKIGLLRTELPDYTVIDVAATAAKLLQSCPTLCDPIGNNPPGSPIPGILQARILEWVAISLSNA